MERHGVNRMEKIMKTLSRQSLIYIILVMAACFGLGIAALFTESDSGNLMYVFLQKGFTAFPVLAVVLTRWITKDKSPWNFSLRVWKRPGLWLFSAIVPGVLIVFGAFLYFVLFPENYSGAFDYGALLGLAGSGKGQITSPLSFSVVTIAIAALFIPIQLLELGEEIGWRAYLLPRQIERYGIRKAVLLNSFLWGMVHFPLIYFGFNYSLKNPLAPWSNIAMMLLVCMVFGVICSYIAIVSGNCMYSAIVHGVINIIGEVPVFLSVQQESGLLGPNPSGIISMSFMIVAAVILFIRLGKVKNKLSI